MTFHASAADHVAAARESVEESLGLLDDLGQLLASGTLSPAMYLGERLKVLLTGSAYRVAEAIMAAQRSGR